MYARINKLRRYPLPLVSALTLGLTSTACDLEVVDDPASSPQRPQHQAADADDEPRAHESKGQATQNPNSAPTAPNLSPLSASSPLPKARFTVEAMHRGDLDLGPNSAMAAHAGSLRLAQDQDTLSDDDYASLFVIAQLQDSNTRTVEHALLRTSLISSGAMSAANANFVDLSWPKVPGAKYYEIRKHGVLYASVTDNTSFRDPRVEPGTSLSYQVSAVLPSKSDDSVEAKANAYGWDGSAPELGPPTHFGFHVTTPSIEGEAGVEALRQKSVSLAQELRLHPGILTHRAFIRGAHITVPPSNKLACEYSGADYKYGGDNRDFTSAFDQPSRVSADVFFNWDDSEVTKSYEIGRTTVYRDGALIDSKQAGDEMFSTTFWDAKSYAMSVESVVGGRNPFCRGFTGAIQSTLKMRAFIDGSYTATGEHRRMPDIEAYWRFWWDGRYHVVTLHRAAQFHPACLIPNIPGCTEEWSKVDLDE